MAITRSDNETQALYPAKIALATNGVISDETPPAGVPVQGVPLGIFKEVRRDNGTFAAAVQVLVDPPVDPDQYEEITLWLNGVQIGLPQQVGNEIITFNMFQSDLRDGIKNVIQYKLKRHSGNQDESTELWALYSATLPGGNDVPGSGEHPGLGISLPAEWGDPANIDKDKIDNKVPLTLAYSHMKAYDKVTVEIGNERFDFTVKPGEVGASFVALIDREQFELVGSQDNCPFSYTVVDQLLNAAHKRRWSKIIRANVDVDGVTLGEPILREILDDSEDVATEIDLGKLAGNDLSVVVLTSPGEFKLGDKIKAEYIATLAGHPDVVEKMEGTVEADEFGEKKRCVLKVANAKVIAGSSVTVTYALFRPNGDPVGKSETASAIVVGTRVVLKPPRIKEAPNDILDPIAAKDTLTAIVTAYDNMIGTQVRVTWHGTPGQGSATTDPVDITEQADKDVTLSRSVVPFNLGKQVSVTYTVIRNSVPQGSDELLLGVLPITDGDPRLGMPLIIEAADSGNGPTLDISALTTNATMRVNSYPFIALEQYVWLRVTGTLNDTNGSEYAKTFWQPPGSKTNSTWISQGFHTHTFPLADLKSLKNGSDLKMVFKTGLGGSADERQATTIKERVYNVRTAAPLVWNDSPVTLTVHTASFEGASPDWDIIADTFSLPLYRGAKEGVPPYTYKSANESVATVDKLGNIKAVGKGKTIITLQDDAGETKTLEATVIHEHYTLLYSPYPGTQEEFVVWAGKVGGKLPPPYFLSTVLPGLYRPKNTSWHHVSYRRNTTTEEMMNPYLRVQFIPFPNIAPFLVVK